MEESLLRAEAAPLETGRGIAKAAGILSLGNVASRILGLVRETVIADLFGASGLVSAFQAASILPTMIYDLLIGGMLSAALVPVFSDYTAPEKQDELWHIASTVLSLATLILSLIVLVLEIFAPQVARLLVGGFDAELLAVTTNLIRIILPAVIFFGLSGSVTALLFALKRFTYPAFGAAIYNTGIIVSSLLLAPVLGIYSLPLGVLLGSILQLAIQLPGLRGGAPPGGGARSTSSWTVPPARGGAALRFSLDLSHPALRRIAALYLPVILGLVISNVGIVIDRNLASRTGPQSIAWMQYATRLIQFPLGLVSAAVSMAILPTLSQCESAPRRSVAGKELPAADFQQTLALGLKMVLVAIIPATVGLFVLAKPIIALVFEHGDFGALDTAQTALALRCYLIGLIFAAVDQPLVFAFYARKDTLTPALVGALGMGIYLAVALVLIRPLGMIGLVLANSVQLTAHALIMLFLVRRWGGLRGQGVVPVALKSLLASLAMGGAAYLALGWAQSLTGGDSLTGKIAVVGVAGGVGVLVYLGAIALLKVEEVRLIWEVVRRKVRA